jgi:hypothetical protein
MSGNRYLLDTNAVVALLKGTSNLEPLVADAEWLGVSIVSVLEFLVFEGLSENDCSVLQKFPGQSGDCRVVTKRRRADFGGDFVTTKIPLEIARCRDCRERDGEQRGACHRRSSL